MVLLNPGPVNMTETIRQAQIGEDMCAKEQEFIDVLTEFRLKSLVVCKVDFSTHDSVLVSGSGTLCQEIAVVSLLPENKKVLMIENGTYSAKTTKILEVFKLPFILYKVDPTQNPDLEVIEQYLKENDDIGVVYLTHQETGTGLLNPIEKVGEIAHKYGAIVIADCISSYGLIPIDLSTGHVDVIFSGTQKGLYAPSGLSFVIAPKDLIEESANYPVRNYYSNLYGQYEGFKRRVEMRITATVQTVYASLQGLNELLEEGIENRYERTSSLYRYIQRKLKPYDFKEVIDDDKQGHVVVSIHYPDWFDFDFMKLHDYCYERGFTLFPAATGIPKTFRISAIGAIDESDIDDFFEIFEEFWTQEGYPKG